MTSSTIAKEILVTQVRATKSALEVEFDDGRSVSLPIAWFPRLLHGSLKERNTWQLNGGGYGIHWPLLDEDLSAASLLAGRRSRESAQSFQRWLQVRTRNQRPRARSRRKAAA
jgi:hypothetical protein